MKRSNLWFLGITQQLKIFTVKPIGIISTWSKQVKSVSTWSKQVKSVSTWSKQVKID